MLLKGHLLLRIAATATSELWKFLGGLCLAKACDSLITYGAPHSSRKSKRQSTGTTFNMTQIFAVTSGQSYTLSIEAEQAQNGASNSSCSVKICADSGCARDAPLTTSYEQYSYTFTAHDSETSATVVIMFSCDGPAYLALDLVSVNPAAAPNTQTIYSTITTTQVSLIPPRTVVSTVQANTSVFVSDVFRNITYTPPPVTTYITTIPGASTVVQSVTLTLSPETTTLTVFETDDLSFFYTSIATVTSTPPPVTSIITTTIPASSLTQMTQQPASTQIITATETDSLAFTSYQTATKFVTTTQGASTIFQTIVQTMTVTSVPKASTVTETSILAASTTTLLLTSTQPASTDDITVTETDDYYFTSTETSITVSQANSDLKAGFALFCVPKEIFDSDSFRPPD